MFQRLIGLGSLWVFSAFLAACSQETKDAPLVPAQFSISENHLYNSNFDLWQRGEAKSVKSSETVYVADRWALTNALGGVSEVMFQKVAPENDGSEAAARLQIVVSPQRGQGAFYLQQTLENTDSLRFFNRPVSASILVKGLGKVNRVALQVVYDKVERHAHLDLGGPQVYDVAPDRWTLLTVQGLPAGKEMTFAGVIGLRIQPVGVSGGNIHDIDNGIVLEQAMMNVGPLNGDYRPKFNSRSQEESACQRYFEKSYAIDVPPGTKTMSGAETGIILPGHQHLTGGGGMPLSSGSTKYRVRKRTTPEVIPYDISSGLERHWTNGKAGGMEPQTVDLSNVNDASFLISRKGSNEREEVYFQWTADAELKP